jgi:Carboxypeptidase regulatory-like domain
MSRNRPAARKHFVHETSARSRYLILLAALSVQTHHALAQQKSPQSGVTSYQISGTVLDPSSSLIPGAQIALVKEDGTAVGQTLADDKGSFRFQALDSGKYRVLVKAIGFRDAKADVSVGARPRAEIRVTMSLDTHAESLTVEASDSAAQVNTDISGNQSSTTLDRNALDRVPVFDQDYIATISRFLDSTGTGTNGVTLIVNGVEANGPGVTASAIQDVKVNQNPYSPLFARPGRARLEITTKGGTPALHSSLNFLLRDSVFDATNAFAVVKPREQRRYFEGSLTGPLTRSGKTTYLLSLNQDFLDLQAIIHARGVNGLIQGNVPTPTRHFFGSGRVFHDFSASDQFWIGYSYERRTVQNQGAGGTVLSEAGTDTNFQEHEINVSYRHVVSTRWVNQLRFLVGHFDNRIKSLNADPAVVVQGAFTGGGAQADFRRTEYHFDGADIVSYVTGKHTLNFGVDIPDISRRGYDDFTNLTGTYTFGSLAAYRAGQPSTYVLQRGQGHLIFLEKVLGAFVEDNIRVKPNFSLSLGMRYYWQNYFYDAPHNLAPRVAFAYAPGKAGKTVFRGGAGLFYDRTGPGPISDLLHFNGMTLLRFILENPGFPVTPIELAAVPTSVVTLDPRARIPHTLQYSAGIEEQVTAHSTFTATYVGSRGMDLFRSINANAPVSPLFLALPDPALGQNREIQSEGYQKSNALEVTFQGKPSRYFTGQVQYTLSKTYNNTSGITFFPANSYNPSNEWARSDLDRKHKFELLGSSQPTRFFTLGLALSLYSGLPVNVITGSDNNGDGVLNDRPSSVPRNGMHGPGLVNVDLNVSHDFVLSRSREHPKTLSASLNSFNVLNHVNDLTYIGVITSPFFGRAVAAQPPRRMQLNLQFKF